MNQISINLLWFVFAFQCVVVCFVVTKQIKRINNLEEKSRRLETILEFIDDDKAMIYRHEYLLSQLERNGIIEDDN